MKKIKLWWRRMQCRIFNRHVYAFDGLKCRYIGLSMEYEFRNRCIHCGGEWRWKIPREMLLRSRISEPEWEEDDDDE